MKPEIIMKGQIKKYLTLGVLTKVIVLVVLAYMLHNKDINFQVNMNSAAKEAEQVKSEQIEQKKEEVEEEIPVSTPRQQGKVESNKKSRFGALVSIFSGKGKEKTVKEMEEGVMPSSNISEEAIYAFIKRFHHVAVSEHRKFGIPASITLANGIYQSSAGGSEKVSAANNYFNIPCTQDWDGMMKDLEGKCFRKYENAWASFRGHSQFITTHFSSLKSLGQDYGKWAEGLQQMGYARDGELAKELKTIIKKYNLHKYDYK